MTLLTMITSSRLQRQRCHYQRLTARSLGEPSIWPEPFLGLRRTRGQVEVCPKTDSKGQGTFDREEPSPAFQAAVSAELEQTSRHERANDVGSCQRYPEERQSDGELVGGWREHVRDACGQDSLK